MNATRQAPFLPKLWTVLREGYRPAMARVMSGELGWTRIDELHRMILDDILPRFGLQAMPEAERRLLNRVWHRLNAWPDVVPGLMRLKQRHVICTLSNGNIGLLTHMARHAQLPWDCVLSAEVFQVYKPDPRVYRGVAEVFDVAPAVTPLTVQLTLLMVSVPSQADQSKR